MRKRPTMPTPTSAGPGGAALTVRRELPAIAAELSARLNAVAGEEVTWSLFVWTRPSGSYVGCADRTQVIPALAQILAAWKAQMPDVPAHLRQ